MDLRYPIGKFSWEDIVTAEQRETWIKTIAQLPEHVNAAVSGLKDQQLDTPYRDGGWTVRQVVHHLADSHMNSFMRFKLALTEEHPTIKGYEEQLWAELEDGLSAPIGLSLSLLTGLHARWVLLLESMKEEDYAKTFYHPGYDRVYRLDYATGMYAWHSLHHTAHITALRQRSGW